MHRRTLMLGTASAAALWLGRGTSRLATAAPESQLDTAGLPRLTVTLDDTGYTVAPASTTAGWTLLTLENRQSQGDNSADLMAIPAGETADSILASLADPAAGPPAWLATATFAGAPWGAAGTTTEAVVRLGAGDWLIFNPVMALAPTKLTVTAGDAAATPPPGLAPTLAVDLMEFAFVGLAKPLPAGKQLWKVTNSGKQPHLMVLSAVPADLGQTQFLDLLTAMLSGTPTADGPPPDAIRNAGGCATLSAGRELFLSLDLAAGDYEAVCFFPDLKTGAPHMAEGMIARFTVA